MSRSTTGQAVSQAIYEAARKLFLQSDVQSIAHTAHKGIEAHHLYAFPDGTRSILESMHSDPLFSDHHSRLVTRKF